MQAEQLVEARLTAAGKGAQIAFDSSRPSLIPLHPWGIFPYADGHFAWSHRQRPGARYRYITVQADPAADIADVEEGCIWPPATVRPWALERQSRGLDVTVYCDRDNVPEVRAALEGVTWHLFLSTLDGSVLTEYDGIKVRACQYTDRQDAYDESAVFDPQWLNWP